MLRRAIVAAFLAVLPQAADAACRTSRAETDIIGIRIGDEESAARVIGLSETLPGDQDKNAQGADTDFPYVRIRSADSRQDAKLFQHYGGVLGAYAEIEVRPAEPNKRAKQVAASELATERGVRLGMREADLVRLLGPCFRRERGKGGEAVIVYSIDDPKHPLLKRTNYPSYSARYAFRNGQLVWFRFALDPV